MANFAWILVAMLACSYVGDAYKILAVFPFPGKSHSILGDAVVRLLLEAGHEVTYITPFIKKNVHPKLRQIDVSNNTNAITLESIDLTKLIENEARLEVTMLFNLTLSVPIMTFHNPNVLKICEDPNETFDVIIAEWMFNEFYSFFGAIFRSPFIWFETVDPHWLVLNLLDGPTNPSFTADIQSESVPPFTFLERIQQLIFRFTVYFFNYYFIPEHEQELFDYVKPLIKKRGHEVPDLEEVRYNVSLMLGNSHVSVGSAMALPQSFKPIGGYHIDPNVKPLPEDLQKLMDNAKHGVIYFSMGSNLRSKSLPQEIKDGLLQMFGTLKETVIWKFEEALPGVPPNVKIVDWAPQQSILAHPNCILFITHGGLLSTTESVYFGKPIIAIPVFADQFVNAERAVKTGYAIKVDLKMNIVKTLKTAIDTMLSDDRYAKRAKELSVVYHHRPVPPGKELVHWVEHVVLTKGARHLRSPALAVNFYQKYFLDLAALIAVVIATLYFIVRRLCCRTQRVKQKRN